MRRLATVTMGSIVALAVLGGACRNSEPPHNQATTIAVTFEAQRRVNSELDRLVLAVSAGRAAQVLQSHARWIDANFFLGTCMFEDGYENPNAVVVDCGDNRVGRVPYASYAVDVMKNTIEGMGGESARPLLECASYEACTPLTEQFWTAKPYRVCQTAFPQARVWENCFPAGADAYYAPPPELP